MKEKTIYNLERITSLGVKLLKYLIKAKGRKKMCEYSGK